MLRNAYQRHYRRSICRPEEDTSELSIDIHTTADQEVYGHERLDHDCE
jgi:hypothetical protein